MTQQDVGLLSYNYEVDDEPEEQVNLVDININSSQTLNDDKQSPNNDKIDSPPHNTTSIDKTQINANNNTGTSSKKAECSAYCRNVYYWIPIRQLCFFGGLALFILPFIDGLLLTSPPFIEWILYWYVQFFALIIILIESPTWKLTRKIQLRAFFFFRFLRRSCGRGFFYITISILTFIDVANTTFVAGLYMMIISCALFVFSILSAKQLHKMYDCMKGDSIDDDDIRAKITNYYHQLDGNNHNKIGSKELHSFASNVLNRKLSNAERYTIQLYLDVSCNGYITEEDWTKQFMNSEKVKFL